MEPLPLESDPRNSRSEVLQVVRSVVADVLGLNKSELADGMDLIDLGASSLQLMVIATELEQSFAVEIPAGWAIPGHSTISHLGTMVLGANGWTSGAE